MKLFPKGNLTNDEYVGQLTSRLDEIAGIGIKVDQIFKHYILLDREYVKNRALPIRVPGGTVGCIEINENFEITKISIDTHYVIKTYPENVEEQLKEFMGTKIEIPEQYL